MASMTPIVRKTTWMKARRKRPRKPDQRRVRVSTLPFTGCMSVEGLFCASGQPSHLHELSTKRFPVRPAYLGNDPLRQHGHDAPSMKMAPPMLWVIGGASTLGSNTSCGLHQLASSWQASIPPEAAIIQQIATAIKPANLRRWCYQCYQA